MRAEFFQAGVNVVRVSVGCSGRRGLAGLLCLFCLAAFGQPSSAQEFDQYGRWVNGVTEPWHFDDNMTAADIAAAQARWQRAGDETRSSTGAGWAGTYFVGGETHGTYLRWSPQGGYAIFSVDKCRAAVMNLDYGVVTVTPSVIHFRSESRAGSPPPRPGGHGHGGHGGATMPAERRFIPVRWRGEAFLVPEDDITGFADYAAGLGDYNGLHVFPLEISHFFFRSDDESAAFESPAVSPAHERFIKKPLAAVVTAVGRRRTTKGYKHRVSSRIFSMERFYESASLTTVSVNVGAAHGAAAGMFFRVASPDLGEVVKLIRVGESSSVGVLVRDLDEEGRETYYDHDAGRERPYPRVAAGWKLTTSLF